MMRTLLSSVQSLFDELNTLKRSQTALQNQLQDDSRTRRRLEEMTASNGDRAVTNMLQASSGHHGQDNGMALTTDLFIRARDLEQQNLHHLQERKRVDEERIRAEEERRRAEVMRIRAEEVTFERKQSKALEDFKILFNKR